MKDVFDDIRQQLALIRHGNIDFFTRYSWSGISKRWRLLYNRVAALIPHRSIQIIECSASIADCG